jgi:glutamate-1-semialdehyde 2,1-aminomutase
MRLKHQGLTTMQSRHSPQLVREGSEGTGVERTASLMARARDALALGDLVTGLRPLLVGEAEVMPQFLELASGCEVTDTSGRRYIDWLVGFGSALLGYRHREVEQAIRDQLAGGPTLSMMHPLEIEVAELLIEMIPCAERVAFGKNGSDALSAAVRTARAATGRPHILCCGYHGFHDWYAGLDPAIRGIPDANKGLTHAFPYNDLAALGVLLRRHRNQVAAVVLEPFRDELPAPGYLAAVCEQARRDGALVVFDEVVTGFRVANGGAQELFGVTPDLACFGKALANGMPLSALVGSKELMQLVPQVGVDMTFRGETMSLAAALAVLRRLKKEPIAPRLAAIGELLRRGVEEVSSSYGVGSRLVGHPSRLGLRVDDSGLASGYALSLVLHEALARGVITNGSFLPTAAHDEAAVARTLDALAPAFAVLQKAVASGGREAPPPFASPSQGFLDSAAEEESGLRLSGWLLARGEPADSIELLGHGGVVKAAVVERRDVVGALGRGLDALRCGWAAFLPRAAYADACGFEFELRALRHGRIVFRCWVRRDTTGARVGGPQATTDGCLVRI